VAATFEGGPAIYFCQYQSGDGVVFLQAIAIV